LIKLSDLEFKACITFPEVQGKLGDWHNPGLRTNWVYFKLCSQFILDCLEILYHKLFGTLAEGCWLVQSSSWPLGAIFYCLYSFSVSDSWMRTSLLIVIHQNDI
jgi:hypothetical protein